MRYTGIKDSHLGEILVEWERSNEWDLAKNKIKNKKSPPQSPNGDLAESLVI